MVFKFSNKQQFNSTYFIFTLIAFLLGLMILDNWGTSFYKESSRLLVSILAFISIMVSIKQASKEFLEISIDGDTVSFKFRNKKKKNITFLKKQLSVIVREDKLEFTNKLDNELVGRVFKNRIIEQEDWSNLISLFK